MNKEIRRIMNKPALETVSSKTYLKKTWAQATNIQPTTLSLIYSIALYTVSRSWDEFLFQYFKNFGDMDPKDDSDDDESLIDKTDEDEDNLNLGLQTPNDPCQSNCDT
ncbi:hypothetical protein RhiirA4_481985 [Rhizophagus irregularis]|uniref:Uncharacterized protein n=1 Tax=Rhizophagus irregularis TaxID=588596 RepID=A0A2I1HKD6_9GLOM|nr:hypothetical protein RhiirA4_481985 [Rhizophagus irregularis]